MPVISIDIDVNVTLTSRPVIRTSAWERKLVMLVTRLLVTIQESVFDT